MSMTRPKAAQIVNVPNGEITATNVQDAIDQLNQKVTTGALTLTNTVPQPEAVGTIGRVGTAITAARADHAHSMPGEATTSAPGFMGANDKSKLNKITFDEFNDAEIQSNLTVTSAKIGNQIYNYNFSNNNTTTQRFKIATLPASSDATYDHIRVQGVVDNNWTSTSKTAIELIAGNRGGLTVQYLRGPSTEYPVNIDFYTESNGSVSVWVVLKAGGFSSASLNITDAMGTVVTYKRTTNATPTGTLAYTTNLKQPTYTQLATTTNSGLMSAADKIKLDSASTSDRAFPKRSDGTNINFVWTSKTTQPKWLWGVESEGVDENNYYVFDPTKLQVDKANIATELKPGANQGIVWTDNPFGGSDDKASITLESASDEDMRMRFKLSNDASDYFEFTAVDSAMGVPNNNAIKLNGNTVINSANYLDYSPYRLLRRDLGNNPVYTLQHYYNNNTSRWRLHSYDAEDAPHNGVEVAYADVAGSVSWSGVSNPPSTYPPSDHTHPLATRSVSGFMSPNDRLDLDRLRNYAGWGIEASLFTDTAYGYYQVPGTAIAVQFGRFFVGDITNGDIHGYYTFPFAFNKSPFNVVISLYHVADAGTTPEAVDAICAVTGQNLSGFAWTAQEWGNATQRLAISYIAVGEFGDVP